MSKFQEWLHIRWQLCFGVCLLLIAVLLGALVFEIGFTEEPQAPVAVPGVPLDQFTIVTNSDNLTAANELAAKIKAQFKIELPVSNEKSFAGGNAIYFGTREFNSYGGYRYQIGLENKDGNAELYLDGTGASLAKAVTQLLTLINKSENKEYPFGMTESQIGYEWNTTDVTMTDFYFVTESIEIRELAPGVLYYDITYKSKAFGTVKASAAVLKADSEAKLKLISADWNETHTASNPAPVHTITEYAEMLTKQGDQVLVINNASFFDNEGDYIPMGIQIQDGVVKKEPSKKFPKWSDNWFGVTMDGEYVFSNTDGYMAKYKDKNILKYAVSGGDVLMRDGVIKITGCTGDYRTAIGTNDAGDLAYIAVHDANMAVIVRVMMDLDIDITTIQNLDGGGSTDFHVLQENGELESVIRENSKQRPVTDALAIVISG